MDEADGVEEPQLLLGLSATLGTLVLGAGAGAGVLFEAELEPHEPELLLLELELGAEGVLRELEPPHEPPPLLLELLEEELRDELELREELGPASIGVMATIAASARNKRNFIFFIRIIVLVFGVYELHD